jgi:hypothetical protein
MGYDPRKSEGMALKMQDVIYYVIGAVLSDVLSDEQASKMCRLFLGRSL